MRRTRRLSPPALLAVAISTTLICLIALTNAATGDALQRSVRTAIRNADVVVTAPAPGRLPAGANAQVARLNGVSRVTEQIDEVGIATNLGRTTMAAQSITDSADLTLHSGRLPAGKGEAVLAEVDSKRLNAAVGTRVVLNIGDAKPYEVTIVGLVDPRPGAVERSSLPTLLGSVEAVQAWSGRAGATRLAIDASGDPEQLAAVVRALPGLADARARVATGEAYVDAHQQDYTSGARTVLLGLRLVGLVTLLAALVVISNTSSLKAAQRTRELAILRCLGAARRQIFASMLIEGILTGLLGAGAGVFLGHALGALVLGVVDVGLPLRFQLDPVALILPVIVGVLVSVLAVLRPARRATRITPLEALRRATPLPARRAGRLRLFAAPTLTLGGLALLGLGAHLHVLGIAVIGGLTSVLGVVVGAPVFFPTTVVFLARFAGRRGASAAHTVRANPRRTGTTSLAVWFGVTLITAVLVGSATAAATLGGAIDEGTPTDVVVASPAPGDSVAARLGGLPEVAASVPVDSTMLDATLAGRRQLLTVVPWQPDLPSVLRTSATVPEPAVGTIQLPPSAGVGAGAPVRLGRPGEQVTLRADVVEDLPGLGILSAADYAQVAHPSGDGGDVWVTLRPGVDESAAQDDRVGCVAVLALFATLL